MDGGGPPAYRGASHRRGWEMSAAFRGCAVGQRGDLYGECLGHDLRRNRFLRADGINADDTPADIQELQ